MPDFDRSKRATWFFTVAASCLVFTQCAWADTQYTMNGKPVSKEVYEAGNIVNQSVPLLQQNRNQEAVDQLFKAEQMAPDMANVHTNLGLGLAKLGRNQEALKELETAKSLDPDLAATWLTLGGIYQSQGMVNQAIDTYSEFIRRFPEHKDASKIASLVTGLKKEVADGVIHPASASGQEADNYLGEMGERANRWPQNKIPIKVYIRPGDGVPGYKPIYMSIVEQSFNAWQAASQGGLSFQPVSDPGQADLECSFTDDSSTFKNRAEAGETYLLANGRGPFRGTIKLLTVPLVAALPLTDNRMRQICLHEIGHAIGFGAHTSNPEDVMFYSTSVSDAFPHLSARDANSVRILYGGGGGSSQTPVVNQQTFGGRNPGVGQQ